MAAPSEHVNYGSIMTGIFFTSSSMEIPIVMCKEMGWDGKELTGFIWLRIRTDRCSCEHVNTFSWVVPPWRYQSLCREMERS
jgi:hypothetical protein